MTKIFKTYPPKRAGRHKAGDKTPGQKAKHTRLTYKGQGGSVKTGTRYKG